MYTLKSRSEMRVKGKIMKSFSNVSTSLTKVTSSFFFFFFFVKNSVHNLKYMIYNNFHIIGRGLNSSPNSLSILVD